MSFLPPKPFNPPTTTVPILGSSSGNPLSFQDPKSVASIGSKIQAMTDQAKADTLYDAPTPKLEGFTGGSSYKDYITATLLIIGITLIVCSYKVRVK